MTICAGAFELTKANPLTQPRLLPEPPWNASTGSRFPGFGRHLGCFELGRLDEQIGDLGSPIQKPRSRNHDQNAGGADGQLLPDTSGVLNQDPMRPKGQKYTEAENRKRVLTAQDHRT